MPRTRPPYGPELAGLRVDEAAVRSVLSLGLPPSGEAGGLFAEGPVTRAREFARYRGGRIMPVSVYP